jgi:hypothetical protein
MIAYIDWSGAVAAVALLLFAVGLVWLRRRKHICIRSKRKYSIEPPIQTSAIRKSGEVTKSTTKPRETTGVEDESPDMAVSKDVGSGPSLGYSPREDRGPPFQYDWLKKQLENSEEQILKKMDRLVDLSHKKEDWLEMRLAKLDEQMLTKWDVALVVGTIIAGITFVVAATVALIRYIGKTP